MRISYIINTNCLDARAVQFRNPWRMSAYSQRAALLKEKVLPAALSQGFAEIIVAGSFEEGEGYTYVPVTPRCRDRRDALWQREMGARHASGDILIFGHDDHMLSKDFGQQLRKYTGYPPSEMPAEVTDWDLLIPQRVHGITGATLNNGRNENYMGGHVLVMKRWLWAQVPWTTVDTEFWDRSLTRIWREAGGALVFADDLIHIDVEAAENES